MRAAAGIHLSAGAFALKAMLAIALFSASAARGHGKHDPYPPPAPPWVVLADAGRPTSSIVAAADGSAIESRAVDELRAYVEKITGVKLLVASSPLTGLTPIYIGAAARTALPEAPWNQLGEGFVVRSGPAGVFVAGGNDLGTLYAVYQLLEKHIGVRWFMPGPLGEVVPKTARLAIGTFAERETPSFRIRWVEDGDWALRQKMNADVAIGGQPVGIHWKWSFHTHFMLVPPEKHFAQHPQWFAQIDGQRRRPRPGKQGQQLCTSNRAVVEEMAQSVIRMFDADPSIDVLALSPQDGGGFCQCDACRALDENRSGDEAWHATYSNRLAVFNNLVARRVAAKYPDKLLKVGAYAMYLRVPSDPAYRPEPNLAVQVCHTYSCNVHRIDDARCAGNTRYFRQELEHWARLTDHLFIYEYYNKGAWGGLPYEQVRLIRHDIPYYHRLGAEGFYTQPAGRRWAACGLNHYVAAKLLWNVDLDVDRLLDDYYQKYYAEAAGPMRRYGDALAQAFVGYDDCLEPYGWKWTTLVAPKAFTADALAALDDAVGRAEKAARSPAVRQRVALVRQTLDYTQRVVHYLNTIQAPYRNIKPTDEAAMAAAGKQAAQLGEPLSLSLRQFCRDEGIEIYDRLINVHKSPSMLIEMPGRKRILR